MACWSTYCRLVRSSFCEASRKRRDSYGSALKALTTMWPLNVSCRIWLSSPCFSCVRRLVPRMRRPILRVGRMMKGRMTRLSSASRQSLPTTTRASTIAVKNWRSRSARMWEMATCTLSMSFMIDDIRRPVDCASKNSAPCFCTLSKTVLRRFVTAENPT